MIRDCDQKLLAEIADYFRPIRDEALESGLLNPKNLGVNIKTLLYQVPGGMLSNLTSQLKELGRRRQVLRGTGRGSAVCERTLVSRPLVTPSSQIVGTQAVIERYAAASVIRWLPKQTKDVLCW